VFIDSSAIVAILGRESDASELSAKLDGAAVALTSPMAIYESSLALARLRNSSISESKRNVLEFLREARVTVVEIATRDGEEAISAFDRFGKGRHKARLNMGDCFAFACAINHGVPLLCKGDDFVHTDIALA
jgi:ribonuclease VapC